MHSRTALALVLGFWGLLARAEYSPGQDAEAVLGNPFRWPHATQYSKYQLLIQRADTSTIVHSALVDAASPGVCDITVGCLLTEGMPGYPALQTLDYKWAVLGYNTSIGLWQWLQPYWSAFHSVPQPSAALTASWAGDQLQLDWPASPTATSYRLDIGNVFVKDSAADFTCATAACSGTTQVAHIPYGTIRLVLRACGINGRCALNGPTTEVYRASPTALVAPNIALPASEGTVEGMTTLVWQDQENIEGWNVRIEKDLGGPLMTTLVDQPLWRNDQIVCLNNGKGHLCSKSYALSPGLHILTLTAYSGGVWGPSSTIAFTVTGNSFKPEVLGPAPNATASVQPVLLWRHVADQNGYVVSIEKAGATTQHDVTCTATPCSFEPAATAALGEGTYRWRVRVAADGMPFSDERRFRATFGYSPPPPQISSPQHRESIGVADRAAVVFTADPQVPFFVAYVADQTSAFQSTSPRLVRGGAECKLVEVAGNVQQNCAFTTVPLTAFGWHTTHVDSHSFINGAGATKWTSSNFRDFIRHTGQTKDIYTIYAQNTQFLPAFTKGGASSAYGKSDVGRAIELVKYIRRNEFDVVALSEVFTDEAKDTLSLHMQGYPWQFGHIDTAGDPAFTLREGLITEQDSGLAIYSRFPADYVPNKGWDSNSQCTDDEFNQISETHPAYESDLMALNDYLWFGQYCEAEGMDAMAAKGFAAIRVQNPRTGLPLLIAWSHTQATTDQGPLMEIPLLVDYSYEDSYKARDAQIQEARDSLENLFDVMSNPMFDAFVLGDWNVPQPASVGKPPSYDATTDVDIPGGGVLAELYDRVSISTGVLDSRNPKYSALVGSKFDPTPDGQASPETLYSQYEKAFDPRNSTRYLKDFYDLWLENPAGDFGYTFDVTGRRSVVGCVEVGEPCHNQNPPFDSGQRYDTVLARFHASNIPNMGRTDGEYSAGHGTPAWSHKKSCVQHLHLARDYALADHFGTIIEVGPEAQYCNPSVARADPQDRRQAGAPPAPNDRTFDAALGVHEGKLEHGGANQWFYISKPGGIDVILERKDASIPALTVEAYPVNDISDRLNVADSEQHTNGVITGVPACNPESAAQSITQNGHIPRDCAKADARVSYWSPGPMYLRIYAANADGTRCTTCVGSYRVRIRERTCKVPFDAVMAFSGIRESGTPPGKGWFGEGQPRCWFQLEIRQPTQADDFQTLTIANLDVANDAWCNSGSPASATCTSAYKARLWEVDNDENTDDTTLKPPLHAFVHQAPSDPSAVLTTGNSWRIEDARKNPHHLKKLLVEVDRTDPSRAHVAVLPWDTDLKSVRFIAVTTTDIDDDSTSICVPILGCAPDPFNTEDEGRIRVYINGAQVAYFDHDFEIDNGSVDRYSFPNRWPGSADNEPPSQVYGGLDKGDASHGWTINFTESARVDVEDRDSDSGNDALVADHIMCGNWPAPAGMDKQTNRIIQIRASLLDDPERFAPKTYDFSDENCDLEDRTFHYQLHMAVTRLP